MDAPAYPPASAFEQPAALPFERNAETLSLGELMRSPSAWAIVLKHAPAFRSTVTNPQVAPILTNMTVESFMTYGVVTRAQIDAINADLGRVPAEELSAL